MEKKIGKNKILICIALIVIIILVTINCLSLNKKIDNSENIENINSKKIDNLMIVAHPDDEMLWGGISLIKEKYLVVCITCGTNNIREKEFEKVMNETKDDYIMLNYPDKTNFRRNNWDMYYDSIKKDLEKIIKIKKWNKVVTHNLKGEYGHIHHLKTNKIVTELAKSNNNLYYFGEYYTKKEIANKIPKYKIEKDLLDEKIKILKNYKTQKNTVKKFEHTNAFEELEK